MRIYKLNSNKNILIYVLTGCPKIWRGISDNLYVDMIFFHCTVYSIKFIDEENRQYHLIRGNTFVIFMKYLPFTNILGRILSDGHPYIYGLLHQHHCDREK